MGGVGQLVLSGPLVLAVPVAAAAGAVSFLSPCCLPLVPGYLSYVTGMSGADLQQRAASAGADLQQRAASAGAGTLSAGAGTPSAGAGTLSAGAGTHSAGAGTLSAAGAGTHSAGAGTLSAADPAGRPGLRWPRRADARRGRTLAGATLFVLGFAGLFATYGALFGGLGATLSAHERGLVQVLGVLTIVLGLLFMGVFERLPLAARAVQPRFRPRAGLAGAPLLGVMFGIGWTPCIGPTLTAVLSLSLTTGTAARGALLAFVYALGLGIPFLAAAAAVQYGLRVFGFARRHARLIMQAGGAMLVVVGLLQVTGAWGAAVGSLQQWISGYTAPL